jgi:acyl-coenzyme A thioesterase PaaI-like protein
MHLDLRVDESSGVVSVEFVPQPHHIGFVGIVHGGVIATVLDEAMVWAASWGGRRFCVCGEMSVRFRNSALVGQPLTITARVESRRARLITASGEVRAGDALIAAASGKYVPIDPDRNRAFIDTFTREPASARAMQILLEPPAA